MVIVESWYLSGPPAAGLARGRDAAGRAWAGAGSLTGTAETPRASEVPAAGKGARPFSAVLCAATGPARPPG